MVQNTIDPDPDSTGILMPKLSRHSRARHDSEQTDQNDDDSSMDGDEGRSCMDNLSSGIINMHWWGVALLFAGLVVLSWLTFACIWYAVAYFHGDLHPDNLPHGHNQIHKRHTPCVRHIHGFTSCLLFSIETQRSIGYGSRQITDECAHAIIIMQIQCLVSLLCSAGVAMVMVIQWQWNKPRHLIDHIRFSKRFLVNHANNALYLCFRFVNMRRSNIINARVTVHVIHRKKYRKTGRMFIYKTSVLPISLEQDNEDFQRDVQPLMYTRLACDVFHKIDSDSPFYDMGKLDFRDSPMELLVVFEGIVVNDSSPFRTTKIYPLSEVAWGPRFTGEVFFEAGCSCNGVTLLNKVKRDRTCPSISARELAARQSVTE